MQLWLRPACEPQPGGRMIGQSALGLKPPVWLTAGAGAAWVLLTLCGWGTEVPHLSVGHDVVASIELVGLPFVAAALGLAARPRASQAQVNDPTH